MRVEVHGFPPDFVTDHEAQIRSLATRAGQFRIVLREIAPEFADYDQHPETKTIAMVTIGVERWQNREGDEWLVVTPATEADAKAAERYQHAIYEAKGHARYSAHAASSIVLHEAPSPTVAPRRLPVFQQDRMVGSLPSDFAPDAIRSKTFLYDPRPGDFRRQGDTWIASNMLGPGDLDAVPEFRREG